MKKILAVILTVILALIIGGVLYLGYLGFIPGLAALFGSDKPRDLGVAYSAADYTSADSKAQVKIETMPSAPSIKAGLVCLGQKPVINSFSGPELTAVINGHSGNWKYYPVSQAQLKINADGSAEVSALLHFDRLAGYAQATGMNYTAVETVLKKFYLSPATMPIYLAGTVSVANGQVNLALSKAEIGRANVPNSLSNKYSGAVNSFFSQQVNAFPGFYIEALDFQGGKMNFKGTMPETVRTVKN
jgi:hypothetical protein